MIKIEFPADRKDIAAAIGNALRLIGGEAVPNEAAPAGCAPHPGVTLRDVADSIADAETPFADAVLAGVKTRAEQPGDFDDIENAVSPQTDHNGVEFNADFCGKSAEPFYTSGPRLGQWKKRRGVDEAAYDDWYALQRHPNAPADDEPEQPEANTAAAFAPQPAAPELTDSAGKLLVWVSEQQAAGKLTQDDVQAAYAEARCANAGVLFANEVEFAPKLHAALLPKVRA